MMSKLSNSEETGQFCRSDIVLLFKKRADTVHEHVNILSYSLTVI